MSVLVDRVASRWVQVSVYTADGDEHFLWCRRPGPDGPDRLAVLHAADTHDPVTGVALVAPSVDGDTLVYRVGGPSSAAAWLARPEPGFLDTALDAVHRAAGAVRAVTHSTEQGAPAVPPAPLQRLRAHLEGRPCTAEVHRWRTTLDAALGTDGAGAITEMLGAHLGGETAPAHGGLSIGGIIPSTTALPDCVLSGEDWGHAAPGHDVGWLIGELLELADSAAHRDDTALAGTLTSTIQTLAVGHEDPTGLVRGATLRVALHAEDYCHFVGWDDTLLRRASLMQALSNDDTWLQTGHLP